MRNVLWIPYREDSTNRDKSYARNYLRLEILPALEKINAGAVKHLLEAAELFSETEAYFQEKATEWIKRYGERKESSTGKCISLSIPQLKNVYDIIIYHKHFNNIYIFFQHFIIFFT